MTQSFRLATFNLENLDDVGAGGLTIDERAALLRPQLERLRADVLCLQEVNAREHADGSRDLAHLDRLLDGTDYAGFHRAATSGVHGKIMDKHNLVVLSRDPISAQRQLRHDLVPPAIYQPVTGEHAAEPEPVEWERPIQLVDIEIEPGRVLHIVNLHLRSRLASFIPGRKTGPFSWARAESWAEGAFLSTIKRNGQALEARLAIDQFFDAEPEALVAVCGDLNAEADEVAVEILRADTDNTGNPKLTGRVLALLRAAGDPNTNVSMLYHGRGLRPDHILVSRSLLGWYHSLEVHNELLHDEAVSMATGTPSAESWHAPVVANFEIN
jgi:endonuclease/exonuclease/phosphatase family metal-dependent hydrolase